MHMGIMKKIVTALLCLAFLTGNGDVLYWQVDENTTVDGGDIQEFLEPYPSDYDYFPAARVRMVSSDGSSSIILKVIGMEEQPEYWGVEPWNNWSGYWGTGICQSQTGYNTITPIVDELTGNIISYPPEVMEVMFIMELGYNIWDDNAGEEGDYVWQTLAESAPELYKDLVSRYMYAQGDIRPGPYFVWTPNFYTKTTPEPSSILLILIGMGPLFLKRKTNT